MSNLPSIFGIWKLDSVESTTHSVEETASNIPISAFLVNSDDQEELEITQITHDSYEIEEIQLTYRNEIIPNGYTKIYQLGKWNIELYDTYEIVSSIIFAGIQSDQIGNELFQQDKQLNNRIQSLQEMNQIYQNHLSCRDFTIIRFGMLYKVQSSEIFTLSIDGNYLHVRIEYVDIAENTTIIKTLKRKENISHPERLFQYLHCTLGWLNPSFYSSEVLKYINLQFINVFSIKIPEVERIDSTIVQKTMNHNITVLRRIDMEDLDGQYGTYLRFLVTFKDVFNNEEVSWIILHRYKEFDALRLLIESHVSQFPNAYWKRIGKSPSFPRKKSTFIRPFHKLSNSRGLELQKYLLFHCSRGGHNLPIVTNSICSFLEIPEHLFKKNILFGSKSSLTNISIASRNRNQMIKYDTIVFPLPLESSSKPSTDVMIPSKLKRENSFTNTFKKLLPLNKAISEKAKPISIESREVVVVSTNNIEETPTTPIASSSSIASIASTLTPIIPSTPMSNDIQIELESDHDYPITPMSTNSSTFISSTQMSTTTPYSDISSISLVKDPNSTRLVQELFDEDFIVRNYYPKGVIVYKHGRYGKSKQRLLLFSADKKRLFYRPIPNDKTKPIIYPDISKSIILANVTMIYTIEGILLQERMIPHNSLQVFPTSNLKREKLSKQQLECCISLILPDRTFDLRTLHEETKIELMKVLKEVCLNLKIII